MTLHGEFGGVTLHMDLWSLQVVLLGDCVGSILGFDALCQSRVSSGGSRSSSRRGSLVSALHPNTTWGEFGAALGATWGLGVCCFSLQSTEPISPEQCGGPDPLADGTEGAPVLGQASPEPPGTQGDSQQQSSTCR